jgi:hypothetical protein
LRYQSQYADVNSSDDGPVPNNYLRPKLTVKYNLEKKYTPFISGEGFIHLNRADGILFDAYRLSAGMEYEFTKKSNPTWNDSYVRKNAECGRQVAFAICLLAFGGAIWFLAEATRFANERVWGTLSAGLVVAVLVATAWIALVAGGLVWLLGTGLAWPVALGLAALANVAGAAGIGLWMRGVFTELPFAATLRQLKGEAAQPYGEMK